ncbi:MAG TPA: LysR family transcriptional regulator [Roseimicrobium sp.]|nr:LysR family transcriptional regulator [Roseimicrobium sp.]
MNQPLDSRQLRAFITLARTGSFTVAAKELFLSQSAVSHSMKTLETDVGCRLFDRLGRKVVLTQAGEQLLQHAEKILHEMVCARSSLQEMGRWGHSRLRVAASTTACEQLLPAVLREFKESFPQCSILIEPGDTPAAIEMLRTNRVDIALALQPRLDEPLEFHPLFSDELAFITDPLHPWAVNGRVVRDEIPRQNYILYNKKSYTFALVEDYFRSEDMVLNTVIELGSMSAIKELVKLGLGVSILAPWIVWPELKARSLVTLPMGKRRLSRTWGIVHWRGRRLSLAEETFVGLCRSVTENLVQQLDSPYLSSATKASPPRKPHSKRAA